MQATSMSEKSNQTSSKKPKIKKRVIWIRTLVAATLLLAFAAYGFWAYCLKMPGESYRSDVKTDTTKTEQVVDQKGDQNGNSDKAPENSDDAETEFAKELKEHVVHLSDTIGERNLGRYEQLCEAADYVEDQLGEYGYETSRQTYQVRGLDCFNIEAEIKGSKTPEEIVIVGGHYDSVIGTPGANDNGSGTASMLVLAKHFRDYKPEKTLRFVAWTNEEPPYFQNQGEMGSWVYAEKCRKEDQNVVAVLSLETMGYFSEEENSQHYPTPLDLMYPSTGNFIGFVSNLKSRELQHRVIETFRKHAKVPSEGASLPEITPGVGWSDHWSFWQEGYQGIMVTDTAPFRYPHYHEATDTHDKLDYETLSKVNDGLVFVIEDLCR